jgi:hypothetical protein
MNNSINKGTVPKDYSKKVSASTKINQDPYLNIVSRKCDSI